MKLSFIVFLGFFLYSATMDGIHLHKKQTNKQIKNSKKTPIIPLLRSQTKQNVHQLTAVEVKGNVAFSLNVEIIKHLIESRAQRMAS